MDNLILERRAELAVFRSVHHPSGQPAVLFFGQWLVRPLAVAMLPVMVATLVAVLQHEPIDAYLLFGFPGAFVAALLWTAYRMRVAPAEVVVSGGLAEVRTVLDVVRGSSRSPSHPVVDVRRATDSVQVAIGSAAYELSDADWPDAARLVAFLARARAEPYDLRDDNLQESTQA